MKTEMLAILVGIISDATVTPLSSLEKSMYEQLNTKRSRVLESPRKLPRQKLLNVGVGINTESVFEE